VLTGRTRQNKLVHFASTDDLPVGATAGVRVTGAAPHHLSGDLVDVRERPTRRARIPVVAV
jgi:tRNA-2-methylthio-N6-dimethylallyladenosine synthase